MKHQQDISYQRDLFIEQAKEVICQCEDRNIVFGAIPLLEEQVESANKPGRALAGELIGIVCSHGNLSRAFKQVKKNKGVAGVDQVPVGDFTGWFAQEGKMLVNQLLQGQYCPSPVRSVTIPKPNGGEPVGNSYRKR